ncbi:hypothetical protein B0O99DRAFT_5403 [Bisporella sp. PMI_857]|nr:hypothetical protein B0O99DRAFT_5403 [Bisporella sp. PMI_857]
MFTASTMSSETLTVAQILADLSDLQNTDNRAARDLLSANKAVSNSQTSRHVSIGDTRSSPKPQFNSQGRRVPTESKPVPSLMRGLSSISDANLTESSSEEKDEDLERAKELVTLYARREKFKQLGDTGLGRAKEMVDAVVEQYTWGRDE